MFDLDKRSVNLVEFSNPSIMQCSVDEVDKSL